MKYKINIITSLIVAIFIISCKKDVPATLTLSTNLTDIANVDGSVQISVTSNNNWTATISDIWCTITPKSGKGNGVITVTATNNFTTGSRTASLQVVCKELKETAVINQSYSQLSIDSESLAFEKVLGTKTIAITSNTKWQLEIPTTASWLTSSAITGNGKIGRAHV